MSLRLGVILVHGGFTGSPAPSTFTVQATADRNEATPPQVTPNKNFVTPPILYYLIGALHGIWLPELGLFLRSELAMVYGGTSDFLHVGQVKEIACLIMKF